MLISKMNAIPRLFPVLSFAWLALSQWRQAAVRSAGKDGTASVLRLCCSGCCAMCMWVIYTEVRQRKGGRCPADLAVFIVLKTVGNLHGGMSGSIRVNIITQRSQIQNLSFFLTLSIHSQKGFPPLNCSTWNRATSGAGPGQRGTTPEEGLMTTTRTPRPLAWHTPRQPCGSSF